MGRIGNAERIRVLASARLVVIPARHQLRVIERLDLVRVGVDVPVRERKNADPDFACRHTILLCPYTRCRVLSVHFQYPSLGPTANRPGGRPAKPSFPSEGRSAAQPPSSRVFSMPG